MILSQYCKIYPHPTDRDLVTFFSTRTTSVVHVPADMIEDIRQGRVSAEEKETLTELGLLVQSTEEEKREMLDFIKDLNKLSGKFNAIVVLNLDCNLACRYCFEGTRKGRHYLSPETADRFVEFIKKRNLANKDEIRLVFYGGEPLLNIDGIIRISERLKPFAEKKGLKYSFQFITNGTLLTRRTVERLLPFGLQAASVTLDGPREVHNAFRPFLDGAGSFDAIVSNIKDVCGLIAVQVGGNFTRENYREFPRLLDFFRGIGLTPDKIPLIRFDPVVNESSEFAPPDFHDGCMSINEPWLVEAGVFLREAILRRGYRTQKIVPSPCAIQIADAVVLNHDGKFYKCPGLIGRRDCVIGDVESGIGDYGQAHGLDDWKNEDCLACGYLPLCFGGCRYVKLLRDGGMRGVDCKKNYLDSALEALVSQDIRYDDTDGK